MAMLARSMVCGSCTFVNRSNLDDLAIPLA